MSRNEKVDRYIASAADFAQPILRHIREVVHTASPTLTEEIKWGFPFFTSEGEIVCAMRAFKAHCALFFWKGALVVPNSVDEGMGQFGKLTTVSQLPPKKTLVGYVRKALELNAAGVPAPHVAKRRETSKSKSPRQVVAPPELRAALAKNRAAQDFWEAAPPSHRREYADWVSEAKRDETRLRRVMQAVEWMAEGKQRNWKHQ